jgi:hypothetical protein
MYPSGKLKSHDLAVLVNAVGRKLVLTWSSPLAASMTFCYTWMNSSGLLEPSYRSMLPALNLSGHLTSLSGPARAQKLLLPLMATSSTRDRHDGVGILALMCLRSSMTLRRSSRSWPYSCMVWFWVMRHRASLLARWQLPLTDEAASLQARLARSWLLTEDSHGGLPADLFATTRFAASAPCWARAMRGEPLGARRWIDSKIIYVMSHP